MSRIRVLHVVESFGGGVATALNSYIESLSGMDQELEHHLIANIRVGDYLPEGELGKFVTVRYLPKSHFRSILELRATIKELSPDVLHAHSSFAGLYARLSIRASALPIIYTPHCYAFERKDIGISLRVFYIAAEYILSKNTTVVLACSQRERLIASTMNKKIENIYLPNVARAGRTDEVQVRSSRPLIAAVGRVSPQKDPDYFVQVIRLLRRSVDVDAIWIGGGEIDTENRLRGEHIEVTGWLSKSASQTILQGATTYLHTASWEGFPMALLEANVLGLSIFARDIPGIPSEGSEWVCSTPEVMANQVLKMMLGARHDENRCYWSKRLIENNSANQARVLASTYLKYGVKRIQD